MVWDALDCVSNIALNLIQTHTTGSLLNGFQCGLWFKTFLAKSDIDYQKATNCLNVTLHRGA